MVSAFFWSQLCTLKLTLRERNSMTSPYISDQVFRQLITLEASEYEQCEFIQCDLSNADFAGVKFIDCRFIECNLSLVNMRNTALRTVIFEQCKMLGVHFEQANSLGFDCHFVQCNLEASCFYQLNMKGASLEGCELKMVDFTETNLEKAKLISCNLLDTVFDKTNLTNVDFRYATNLLLDPEQNKIRGAQFDKEQLVGLLMKYKIRVSNG